MTKTDCNNCVAKGQWYCKPDFRLKICKNFTWKSEFLDEIKENLLCENKRAPLYNYFYKIMVMSIDVIDPMNRHKDYIFYYSLDHEKFIKRSMKNTKDLGNWIKIEYDMYLYLYLKEKLGYNDPKKTLTRNGRFISGSFVKDDLWQQWDKFVYDTFDKFWKKNSFKGNPKTKDDDKKAKQLF